MSNLKVLGNGGDLPLLGLDHLYVLLELLLAWLEFSSWLGDADMSVTGLLSLFASWSFVVNLCSSKVFDTRNEQPLIASFSNFKLKIR